MTDYPMRSSGWRKRQVTAKFQNLLAIFITAVLLLAVFNGLLRGFSLERSLGKSSWTRGAPLVVAVNSSPGSILIYDNDQKRLVLLTFGKEEYFMSLNSDVPVMKLSEVFEKDNMASLVSSASHMPVGHNLFFDKRPVTSQDIFGEHFKKFASFTTPFEILFRYPDFLGARTNLTRGDLFRLWWGVKSIRLEDLILEDISHLTYEAILADGQKVETVDAQAVSQFARKYLESERLSRENFAVTVKNASGVSGTGQLVADLISAIGFHVVAVSSDSETFESTLLLAGKADSFTVSYLANILDCDIKTQENLAEDEVVVVVGRDFANMNLC